MGGYYRQVHSTPQGRLVIASARPEDAGPIALLYGGVIGEERWFITAAEEHSLGPERMLEQLLDRQRRDNAIDLVARLDRALVGALCLAGGPLRRTSHVGRLELFVAEAARGHGVGRALLASAIEWAEANPRLQKLSLSVFEDNARAVALYRSMGFLDEGRRVGEYRERDGTLRNDLLLWRPV